MSGSYRGRRKPGWELVTDGEQRRENFDSYIVDKIDGHGVDAGLGANELRPAPREKLQEQLRALDVPAFAIKSPVAVDKLRKKDGGLSLNEAAFVQRHSDKPIKVVPPGAYLLTRSAWFEGLSKDAYPTQEDLAADVVKILREEIIALRDMGVAFVQLDANRLLTQVVYGEESAETFMFAALSSRRDPDVEMNFALELMNETVKGIDGVKLGVHVCRGNWSRKEDVLLVGNYGPLLPVLVQMDIDQLVLEMATPRAGEVDVFKEYAGEKEIGLGPVNPRTEDVELVDSIVERTKEFLRYFDPANDLPQPGLRFRHVRRAERERRGHRHPEARGNQRRSRPAARGIRELGGCSMSTAQDETLNGLHPDALEAVVEWGEGFGDPDGVLRPLAHADHLGWRLPRESAHADAHDRLRRADWLRHEGHRGLGTRNAALRGRRLHDGRLRPQRDPARRPDPQPLRSPSRGTSRTSSSGRASTTTATPATAASR